MGTLMEELNAKDDRAGRTTVPDLAMQRGCVHCYLDHDGAGEMTFEGSTIWCRAGGGRGQQERQRNGRRATSGG